MFRLSPRITAELLRQSSAAKRCHEIVTLEGSQQVGTSKRGARNIIPIAGGTLTGKITGKVLFGGADYQSPTSGPAIDARYL